MPDRDDLEQLFDRLSGREQTEPGDVPASGGDVVSPAPDAEADGEYDAVAIDRAERAEREERLAQRRLDGIEAGRRQGGLVGAAMAGAMFAMRELYEGRPQEADIVEQSESPDEPDDIDVDGITVEVDGIEVWAPPPFPES